MPKSRPDKDQGANRYRAFRGMTMQGLTDEVNRVKSRGDSPVSLSQVVNALHGRVRPTETLRKYLPQVLGISLQACFDDRSLSRAHQTRKNKQ